MLAAMDHCVEQYDWYTLPFWLCCFILYTEEGLGVDTYLQFTSHCDNPHVNGRVHTSNYALRGAVKKF